MGRPMPSVVLALDVALVVVTPALLLPVALSVSNDVVLHADSVHASMPPKIKPEIVVFMIAPSR